MTALGLRCFTAALLMTFAAGCRSTPSSDPIPRDDRSPNVVVILADDLGIGDARCYNPASKIPTPALDALAAEGMRFTDAHSPSAVCSPTRYALLTGRYAWRTRMKQGVLWGHSRLLIEPGRSTIASLLRDRGYRTGCFGKWHLGLGAFDSSNPQSKTDYTAPLDGGPHTVGFDESCVIPASLDIPPYLWVRNGEVEEPLTARTEGSKRRWSGGGGFWRAGAMSPSFDFDDVLPRTEREAIAFIRDAAREKTPFFAYVPLSAPHTPWLPGEDYADLSEAGAYGDFVAQVDATIGRIVAAVDAAGQRESTLVIVTSDNGSHWPTRQIEQFEHHANGPYRGQKADVHEGGHRVPFIARWVGRVPPGTETDALIGLQDLYATMIKLVPLPMPIIDAPDSESFLATLRDPSQPARTTLVHHSLDGMFALRHGSWKWIEGLGSGGFTAPKRVKPGSGQPAGQLYDLSSDREEGDNRASTEPDRVAELSELLDRIRQSESRAPH